jgi:hypothetical protein
MRLPSIGLSPLAPCRRIGSMASRSRPFCRWPEFSTATGGFVVDGQAVVTGFAAVGDAWACTNPSAGRGLSVGLLHAQLLRNIARAHIDDPGTFALAYDAETEGRVTAFYRNQIAADRARIAEMNALSEGTTSPPPPAPNPAISRLIKAASHDAGVFRAMLETVLCVALPQEIMTRPYVIAKMAEFERHVPPPDDGIDQDHLMCLLEGRTAAPLAARPPVSHRRAGAR